MLVYWGAVTVGLVVRAMTEGGRRGVDGGPWRRWPRQPAGRRRDAASCSPPGHLIPGVLSGMVLAAVLAAICSTADSQLVVAASSGANDLYVRLCQQEAGGAAHMLVNRLVVFGLGIGAMLLVMDSRVKVYNFVLNYGWAILGASFGPQMILVLLWRRASYAGCVAGMVTGFVVALLWPQIYDPSTNHGIQIYNLPLAFLAALAVNLAVSAAVPDRPPTGEVKGRTRESFTIGSDRQDLAQIDSRRQRPTIGT